MSASYEMFPYVVITDSEHRCDLYHRRLSRLPAIVRIRLIVGGEQDIYLTHVSNGWLYGENESGNPCCFRRKCVSITRIY